MTRVTVPERTYSSIYIDDRHKHKYAITVRHAASVEIMRFYTEESAVKWQRTLKKQGYKKRKR